jgi:DNA repair protein RadA/Sms
VLYFEGDRHHSHRVIRAVKNRFGAVSELGVFEMTGSGLAPVANPSKLFLASARPGSRAPPCCAASRGRGRCSWKVQALVSTSTFGNARRMAIGIDHSRLALLLAVLEKRAGLNLAGDDVYVNIAGGMSVEETAADLSVLAAVTSSVRNRGLAPVDGGVGEVGLSGEIRGIPQAALRRSRASQMGFTRRSAARGQRRSRTIRRGGKVSSWWRSAVLGEALDALIA